MWSKYSPIADKNDPAGTRTPQPSNYIVSPPNQKHNAHN